MSSKYNSQHRRCAFTLIELLVVIVVIALLLAVLLPAVQAARSAARKTLCANRMKQIGLAIQNYHAQYDQFPPSKWGIESPSDSRGRIKHHVLSFILPFMEQQALYDKIDFSKHWYDNQAVKISISSYQCPDAPRHTTYGNAAYFTGDYTVAEQMQRTEGKIKPLFDDGIVSPRSSLLGALQPADFAQYDPVTGTSRVVSKVVSTATVTDGLSHTMFFFESAGRPHKYTTGGQLAESNTALGGADWASNVAPVYLHNSCGGDGIEGGMQLFNCSNENEIFAFHVGGANFAYGDGTVRFHVVTIHPEIFISLFTSQAGDIATID